ncbi:hypothetical protein RT717_21750 [Imperialibacter roseus]|uniref:HTH tetR-type domain-containing protein n=1 Tax=Imperialibacter roseus TaxID=1324217 RepID=A0ABZ0IL11_9BACT|nr:hypothetical protein [Imperialibacter roseus]WOK05704.1 hypothetical protein RT717_21750 [Imperialibacter roseus]
MKKTSENKLKWIECGYSLFASIGPEALNIERLSGLVSLSRSSFYYYFGDLVNFEHELLKTHIMHYKKFGQLMRDYVHFEQLFSDEIMENKIALAFHVSCSLTSQ